MYVTNDMIDQAADRYGTPQRAVFVAECSPGEFDFIRSTQKHDRAHDVTCYIRYQGNIVVNAKHFYPAGMYRAPSGGLEVGERLEDGIARELAEETGCLAAIEKFVLISRVFFVCGQTGRLLYQADDQESAPKELLSQYDTIAWTSLVFQLQYTSGDFQFTDHHEIREVTTAPLSDFDDYARMMRSSDKGGLHYRAALHDAVTPLLKCSA